MWFEKLTGFREESPAQVRANLKVEGNMLRSLVNDKSYCFGCLEVPTLSELRKRVLSKGEYEGRISVTEVVGNVQAFHKKEENEGALFQAASQFNLLEMVGPSVKPEKGVGIYEHDYTQGPACAIACGAGTIYRNYFAEVNGKVGQTASNQIDCLEDIGVALQNNKLGLWKMQNGYALATRDGLRNIAQQIEARNAEEYEELKGKLKIGLQWDTETTLGNNKQKVTQVYCSALPVAYSSVSPTEWGPFAQLVLEATYEATLAAALLNFEKTGNNKVYLTMVGGGAFGNHTGWIINAIKLAVRRFLNVPLDVKIVSYRGYDPAVSNLVKSLKYIS